MIGLADKHNFGRAVSDTGFGFIEKPRPVYWEWLFLSSESHLRKYFAQKANNPFTGFPDLKFTFASSDYSAHKVEKLDLESVSSKDFDKASSIIGKGLAVCKFFGLTDLHKENVFFGTDQNGNIIFCPVDIECVFEKSDCLSQNQLVRSTHELNSHQGLKVFEGVEINVAILLETYLTTLQALSRDKNEISKILFQDKKLKTVPIRLVLDSTSKYVSALAANHFEQFTVEEEEQLARGDVPYFYTYLGDENVYFLGPNQKEKQCSFKRLDTNCLESIFCEKMNSFNFKQDVQFLKTSLCQLARALDSSTEKVEIGKSSIVKYTGNKILINLLNKMRISCTRLSPKSLQQDLSA